MEKKLITKFYKVFITSSLGFFICIMLFLIGTIITLNDCLSNDESPFFPLVLFIFLIVSLIIAFRYLRDYFFDLSAVRKKDFKTITGVVIRLQKVEGGGEVPPVYYYPIIRDDETGKEIGLTLEGCLIGCRYKFLYLEHTKIAVISENISGMICLKQVGIK